MTGDRLPEWPCAMPRCSEPAVYPHARSYCKRHYAGEPPEHDTESRPATDGGHDAERYPTDSNNTPNSGVTGDGPGADLMAAAMGDPDAAAEYERDQDDQPDEWRANAGGVGAPTSALPLAQLDALSPHERRRQARKRGVDWPTTDEARERLFSAITEVMREGDQRVIDAPTSLGKSYTVDTTPWSAAQYDTVTGEKPVVHLSATRDARDEGVERARKHLDTEEWMMLRSRHEACPVAAGDYDPATDDDEDVDHDPITIHGEPASEWLATMCEGRGIAFSAAHNYLHEHNDQDRELPCCADERVCTALDQWREFREGDHSLILATHNFAHVPGLRSHTNIVIDEEPDYTQDLGTQRVKRAVTAFLEAIDAPVQTWEQFISLTRYGGYGDDAAAERDALRDDLDQDPDRSFYFEDDRAHTLAPALARAIATAEERGNGRWFGKTRHEPPRLEANVRDDDGWNCEWVSIVMDSENEVRVVRSAPDFSQARSVVGLDAHPCIEKWSVNTVPYIQSRDVLSTEERRLWRRYERGLRVVQVGDAVRPAGSKGRYYDHDGDRALVEHLRETYGDEFRTAITAKACEDPLKDTLGDVGVTDYETMHYGEEKSRNDFAAERIGLVTHSIDPGDDHVLDLLAELDKDATPETTETETDDGEIEERRAHGRGFDGPDADTAASLLASVRENHVAQAAGRYARNPDDPDSTATVFVRTAALPVGFADVQAPGVVWTYGKKQDRIIETLRDTDEYLTAREIAARVDCSKEHVRQTLEKLVGDDDRDTRIHAIEGAGEHGATLYKDAGVPNTGVVDLGDTANSAVWGPYTWGLAITEPDEPGVQSAAADEASATAVPAGWEQWTREDGGDPPDGSV